MGNNQTESATFDAAAALAALANRRKGPGRPGLADRELADRRKREQNRRFAAAQSRAKSALIWLHKEEYDALYAAAVAEVCAEFGPLPGDD